jgi:hypothetical protein
MALQNTVSRETYCADLFIEFQFMHETPPEIKHPVNGRRFGRLPPSSETCHFTANTVFPLLPGVQSDFVVRVK